MTDTPRTDKAELQLGDSDGTLMAVDSDFARELERENAKLLAEIAMLKTCIEICEDYIYDLEGDLAELK